MSTSQPRPRSITDRLEALRAETKVVRFELKADIAGVRTEIAEVRTEIAGLRTELKGDIAGLRTELDGKITALSQDFREFKGTVSGVGVAAITLLPVLTTIVGHYLPRILPGP